MQERNRLAKTLLWKAMAERPKWAIKYLAALVEVEYTTALKYVTALKLADYVICVEPKLSSRRSASKYSLRLHTGPHAPLVKGDQILDPNLDSSHHDGMTALWLAMRMTPDFGVGDLVLITGLKRRTVISYVSRFVAAGYVVVLDERLSGHVGGGGRYALARNTGPLAPAFLTDGTVFDPNLKRFSREVA